MNNSVSDSDQIKKIIADQLGVALDKVTDTVTFDDLGADSLDKIEITLQLENNFKIEITDDETEKLLTIGDVTKYIEKKIK